MAFYRDGRRDGDFKTGVQVALSRILTSPNFLFRVEQDPPHAVPGKAYRISDLELASRLSFFLWSSIPDKTLLDLAAQGRLHQPAVLDGQVKRMIADPRSKRPGGQLRRPVAAAAQYPRRLDPISISSRTSTRNCASAMEQETTLFINDQIHRNRSVVELLSARYTFLNERLAQHYGVPGVVGTRMRRVDLPARQPARRSFGPRRPADGHLLPQPHLPGPAGQVGAGQPAGHPAAPAPAQCAGPEGHRRGRQARLGPRAAGGAPQEPRVRGLPFLDGPAGLRPGELRRHRQMAHHRRRDPGGRLGRPAQRNHSSQAPPACATHCWPARSSSCRP